MTSSKSNNSILARAGVAALLTFALSSSALAATVVEVDVAEATRLSEWVVRARVTALAPVDLRAEGDSIYTDVTLAIEAVYRGKEVPRTYVLRIMGGTGKDGLALAVPGMPRFAVGDEAVLFLERTGKGHVPCGLGQGVWRISAGPLGYPVVHRDLRELALMKRGADGALVPSADRGPAPIKLLASLVAEIAAVH